MGADKLYARFLRERREEILGRIAERRSCLLKGNEFDYARAAKLLLDDFRSGRLGRITLELPGQDNFNG